MSGYCQTHQKSHRGRGVGYCSTCCKKNRPRKRRGPAIGRYAKGDNRAPKVPNKRAVLKPPPRKRKTAKVKGLALAVPVPAKKRKRAQAKGLALAVPPLPAALAGAALAALVTVAVAGKTSGVDAYDSRL